jgi:tetratricopeptide (TPR) repeat protein
MRLLGWAWLMLAVAAATVHANEAAEERAKALYSTGRAAYNDGKYQVAYDAFKESFRLSHQPALLYNVASALQGLGRPHDAAESLRSFLRLQPSDPERPQIEERIRTLEEEQRLLDLERKPAPAPAPGVVAPSRAPKGLPPPALPAAPSESASAPVPDHRRRNAIIIGVTVGAAVVTAVALGLAFGLQTTTDPLTPSNIGPLKGTQ